MEKSSSRKHLQKDNKYSKAPPNSSKNKKQPRQTSSKQLKLLKSPPKASEDSSLRKQASPNQTARSHLENDYGVSTFYAKYKVKTIKKKEEEPYENTDYGNFNSNREPQEIDGQEQTSEQQEPEYSSTFQKLRLPSQRALINAEGKFVTAKKETSAKKDYSLREASSSKHSFSLNFTRDGSRSGKRKAKQVQSNQSVEGVRWRSGDNVVHSYYQKRKSYSKKKKQEQSREIAKITQLNSKTSEAHLASSIKAHLIVNESIMQLINTEIALELQASKGTIRKQRLSDAQARERGRCLQLLGKVCGVLRVKRQAFFLAVGYMDQYIAQHTPPSFKIVALAALTLALKMDDAEMTSRFCFHYLYNPEKTVKRNSSGAHLRLKQKQREKEKEEDPKDRSKLSQIVTMRISEDKRAVKEDFSLDEILDFETQMMVRLGFKLVNRTVNYWADAFTALWDSFLTHEHHEHQKTLQFRNEADRRNWSYLIQLLEAQIGTAMGAAVSRISLALGGVYLVARVALQQRREETPWEELCRYYRASLAKSSNLVFCDGVGINPLFGDFLALFDLSLSNIVQAIQALSRHLMPQVLRVHSYNKLQGKNWEDRMATYIYNEDLYKP